MSLMTIKELQEQINEMMTEYDKVILDKPQTKEMLFIHLVEEVGELARQYVNQEHRKSEYDQAEVADGIGDILINTIQLANVLNIDVEPLLKEIIETNNKETASKKNKNL